MSVLDRAALEDSPLADLHAIASELSIDGYRRLRKAALIDAILTRQGDGAETASPDSATAEAPALEDAVAEELTVRDEGRPSARRRRGRRGGRTRTATEDSGEGAASDDTPEPEPEPEPEPGREAEAPADGREDQVAAGVVELLPNGSGFLRVNPPEPSDDDVYISAAQVKRCDLVSGDR